MTPDSSHLCQILKESYFHRQWGDEVIGSWRLSLVGGIGRRRLDWLFQLDTGSVELPRGYVDSVRQRFDLGKGLPYSGAFLKSVRVGEQVELLVDAVEGEPFPFYLKRTTPSLRISLNLLSGVVLRLRELSEAARLLSNLSGSDFLVKSLHGASVETVLHPVFPIIREERSRSDFEIACFWGEYIARYFAAAKDGWKKEVSEYDPASQRTFRKLLKTLLAGRELSSAEALEELERCLRREMDALRPSTDVLSDVPAAPMGAVRRLLIEELTLEYPEKLPEEFDPQQEPLTSPFILPLEDESGTRPRQGVLLPPEGWFEDSLVQAVNRKMATPILADHPNTARVRSLLCEEKFSLIITDRLPGIPLPALLQMKGGVDPADALRLAGKIRRALDQFDSAEFLFEFESPWQIEIYPVREAETADLRVLLSKPCSEWPVWDVRLRVEVPTEEVLEIEGTSAWAYLLQKLDGKAYPALVAWLLEWRRLEWAARQGTLEREPISWDRRFESLFAAAGDYFEPGNPSHRERLLGLLKEGFEPVGGI